MIPISELQTPEMAAWVRGIARSVLQEHLDALENSNGDELRDGRSEHLNRELAAHEACTEQRFDCLGSALVELAQAQKRTEERVEELVQAQKCTEERVAELAPTLFR